MLTAKLWMIKVLGAALVASSAYGLYQGWKITRAENKAIQEQLAILATNQAAYIEATKILTQRDASRDRITRNVNDQLAQLREATDACLDQPINFELDGLRVVPETRTD